MPAVNRLEHDGKSSEGFCYLEQSHWHQCKKCGAAYWVWHECQALTKKEDL